MLKGFSYDPAQEINLNRTHTFTKIKNNQLDLNNPNEIQNSIHHTGQCYVFISRQLGLFPPNKALCHVDAIGKANKTTHLGLRLSPRSSVLCKIQFKREHYDCKNFKMLFKKINTFLFSNIPKLWTLTLSDLYPLFKILKKKVSSFIY